MGDGDGSTIGAGGGSGRMGGLGGGGGGGGGGLGGMIAGAGDLACKDRESTVVNPTAGYCMGEWQVHQASMGMLERRKTRSGPSKGQVHLSMQMGEAPWLEQTDNCISTVAESSRITVQHTNAPFPSAHPAGLACRLQKSDLCGYNDCNSCL